MTSYQTDVEFVILYSNRWLKLDVIALQKTAYFRGVGVRGTPLACLLKVGGLSGYNTSWEEKTAARAIRRSLRKGQTPETSAIPGFFLLHPDQLLVDDPLFFTLSRRPIARDKKCPTGLPVYCKIVIQLTCLKQDQAWLRARVSSTPFLKLTLTSDPTLTQTLTSDPTLTQTLTSDPTLTQTLNINQRRIGTWPATVQGNQQWKAAVRARSVSGFNHIHRRVGTHKRSIMNVGQLPGAGGVICRVMAPRNRS